MLPRDLPDDLSHDTLGVLALDCRGQLSGACTTSGLAYKIPGRVGDSAVAPQVVARFTIERPGR